MSASKKKDKMARLFSTILFLGALHFGLVSLAHFFEIKSPFLYIYFEIPSHAFQDKIIAFFAFGWAAMFYIAAKDPWQYRDVVVGVLLSGLLAILTLCGINLFVDLRALNPAVAMWKLWLETGTYFVYWVILAIMFFATQEKETPAEENEKKSNSQVDLFE